MDHRAFHRSKVHRRSALVVIALLAAGCSSESPQPNASSAKVTDSPTPTVAAAAPETDVKPAPQKQAETCSWDDAALSASSAEAAPQGKSGALQDVIIGAWQHTHINTGTGFKPNDDVDIRYVFPSSHRLLYCQNVPGATTNAERATDFTWNGNRISPPGSKGFTVTAWSEDTMVWTNHLDNSKYLLKRR